jgi:hypothetical protein
MNEEDGWNDVDSMPKDGTIVETNIGDVWWDKQKGYFTNGTNSRGTIYRWRKKNNNISSVP